MTSLKAKQPGGLVFLSLGQTALPFAPLTEPCVAATVAAWKKKRAVDKTADHAQEDPALPACWNTAKPHSWPLLKLARTWMRPRGKNWHIAETLHYRKRGKQLWTPCTPSKHFKTNITSLIGPDHTESWPLTKSKTDTGGDLKCSHSSQLHPWMELLTEATWLTWPRGLKAVPRKPPVG